MTISEKIPEQILGEAGMVQRDRWEEVRRLAAAQKSVSEIARELALDRKTVRRCLRQAAWQPYRRTVTPETLLHAHAAWLRERAPAVRYSARILWQELRQNHAYRGSYETVKRFVRPLRTEALRAEFTWTRFETPPGVQSQIDWGQARVLLGRLHGHSACVRADVRVFAPRLLFGLPRRDARDLSRSPRARLRVLPRAYARASL